MKFTRRPVKRRWFRRTERASMVEFGPAGQFAIEIDPDGFDGLELQRDPSPGSWVAEALWDKASLPKVSGLVPRGYEAYARVNYSGFLARDSGHSIAPLLFDILARHTETPEVAWFCLWKGYGGLAPAPEDVRLLDVPAQDPMRSYLLYRGALSSWDAMSPAPFHQAPDLAWPNDRAWFLATDTDIEFGVVGGTNACISALEREPALGAVRVSRDDPLAGD